MYSPYNLCYVSRMEENSETPWGLLHSVTVGRMNEAQALRVAYEEQGVQAWCQVRELLERSDDRLNANAYWHGD